MQLPVKAIWVFHAVAKAGSVSRAAEELGVTPSAVSQQIQALEVQLGLSLMHKAGRRVVLTEAGERYFATIDDEIGRIVEATSAIRGYRSVTSLTVRATPTLSNKWLLPRLQTFLDLYPDIEIRIDGTNEPTDFNREIVDLEIRHGDGRWPGLFVEGMGEETFVPACAPSLAASGSLSPEDLPSYRLIHSVKSQAQWGRWFAEAGVRPTQRWRRLLFDRSHMAIDAASGGMGIALESTTMMEREFANGTLLCPVAKPPRIGIVTQWIVCPRDHLRHKKVQAFLEWLRTNREFSRTVQSK
ncbi:MULTISPECIES: LysR substrate-binding domain-containing protein [unclassified Aureimonas]|uniref:LysR substrate-binding domain-containing protein n=1 Tax=unclassified Aureimonas TaxID=2615206 RepID=UPI0006F939F4|nr:MULTISPECIES: LysR substrate-binding domain-containing protein [unclassified Aureimonas]KQT61773.1 LysR family transcriptional regulator [Aureimonas sp. Leaf460]KQT65729.1 LysR family transcriptional regulator [Aureimonas sp. Leaf427]